MSLSELADRLGHTYSDTTLLSHALAHRSYCAENEGVESNERLEFLGDSVLGLAVTGYIFANYPQLPEGKLAKLRASVVNTESLAQIAENLEVGQHLLLGNGEDQSGGREKPSILADTVEALIGSVYTDAGWDRARDVVLALTVQLIESAALEPGGADYKTKLQELAASNDLPSPRYEITGQGPDHDRSFIAKTYIGSELYGEGEGTSKKRAEQAAAEVVLEKLQNP